MATTPDQIDRWRTAPEKQHLEFKEAKTQFDNRALNEYCVAIANEGGGFLILGVEDRPPRKVVGTRAFSNTAAMESKLLDILGFHVDIEEVAHPEGRVVVFHIPSRPRGTAYHLGGRYLMRAGSSLVGMTEDQLRRIFAEGAPDWLEEPALTGLAEEQVIELLDTQTFFDLLGQPYPRDRSGVIDRLMRERLVDAGEDGYAIRRLGGLLLAKRLVDFTEISRKAPRVVVYGGTSKLDATREMSGRKGYAVGFGGLVEFVMTQLPQNEVIEDAIRKEVKLVPPVVVRELVANALIHQDFTVRGASVMIDLYVDRFEISNPGEPMVPTDRFIDGYQSRNERLADLNAANAHLRGTEQRNRQGGARG